MKKSVQLVFIPTPGIGHLISTVETAKLLLARDDHLSIAVLVMRLPFSIDGTDSYIESVAGSSISQRIKFIHLSQVDLDPTRTQGHTHANFYKFINDHQPKVKEAVAELIESESTRIAGFVIDMCCTCMIDVANEFGVPSYVYFTSGAAFLGAMFILQILHDDHNKDFTEFKDSNTELEVPSYVNPLPAARVLPGTLFEKEECDLFFDIARRWREAKGILVNTFAELESHAISALKSDDTIPPVYPVGPIINVDSKHSEQKSNVLKWLDDQPKSSVVFLCFGSMGSFSDEQVKEIAHALDHGEFRFLWSLRQAPPKGEIGLPRDYDNYARVLPEGFLDRTNGVGKVIGWAPQAAILAHPAVGGFVSHCGWNSTLESLWFGVPVATWPLSGEQQLNAFQLVKDLGLAVEIDFGYRKDGPVILNSLEIERGIKAVMEVDSGIRKKVEEVSRRSKATLVKGGSSYSSLGHFLNQI